MSGKSSKKLREQQTKGVHQSHGNEPQSQEFSPRVERFYKLMLRTMSWIVGIAFAAILVLPEFNSPTLDSVTTLLFDFGFAILLIFIVIEFISDPFKRLLSSFIHEE